MNEIFRYQLWHLIAVIFLLAAIRLTTIFNTDLLTGELWGLTTHVWLWVAVAIPVLHQTYVWLMWRLELYRHALTSRFGMPKAFTIYTIGFSLLFVGRLISITILGFSSPASLSMDPLYAYLLAALITPAVIYLFYSVKRYFTIARAYGIDHFDRGYNEPFVKRGIFRYTDNGMYIFGLMVLYLPGLLLLSKAALLVALFNHIYIWVHYYCTELPDMRKIYGKAPDR